MSYRQLIALSFLLNGLWLVGLKRLSYIPSPAAIPLAVLCMYMVAAFPALVHAATEKRRPDRTTLLIGVMGGLGGALGTAAAARAAAIVPGYIVFPVSGGGTLLLVAVMGRLVFQERLGPYGMAGIAVGAVAIALLSG